LSYRGQSKGSYGVQRRGYSGNHPYPTKKQSKPFSIAEEHVETQDQNLDPQPTLWLYGPESFTTQAFIAELSSDPAILEREIYQIAQIAATKRKLEIVSKFNGEEPTRYKIIRQEDKPESVDSVEGPPSENANCLGSFQTRLEGLGFTVIPA
jgi:hypothetical protein